MWGHYGLTPEQAKIGGLNPKMFNCFLDGSKPSIESTAVCNATGLTAPSNGLLYPPASSTTFRSSAGRSAKAACSSTKGRSK